MGYVRSTAVLEAIVLGYHMGYDIMHTHVPWSIGTGYSVTCMCLDSDIT